jgi:multidrug efflux pump subunit AcrA (membrane-fusion protein)
MPDEPTTRAGGADQEPLVPVLAAQGYAAPDGVQAAATGGKAGTGTAGDGKTADGKSADARGSGAASPPGRGADQPDQEHEPPLSREKLVIGAIVLVVLFVILLLIGLLPRRSKNRELAERAERAAQADSIPLVSVTRVERAPVGSTLELPGALQPQQDASVYARASGYVRRRYVDIGQHVHRGQVLATIDAPDLDQQLAQAKQTVANQQATLALNKVTYDRWKVLYRDSAVTEQELDQYKGSYEASVASVAAAQADEHRLEALVGFESVIAPFDGVVTARNVDAGTFVTSTGTVSGSLPAGAGGNTQLGPSTPGTELFHVARIDTMRVYVGVPQAYAPSVRVGLKAAVTVQELAGQRFDGRVARTASAIDASSRTLLTEVDVVNLHGVLLPGTYASAHFRFDRPSPPVMMPSTALIFRGNGPQAAVVGSDSEAHFRPITIGRDYGAAMEVITGVADTEYVINDPSDDLRDGQRVHSQVAAEAGAPGGNTPGGRPSAPIMDQPNGKEVKPPAGGTGKAAGGAAKPAAPAASPPYRAPAQVQEPAPGSPGPAPAPAGAGPAAPRGS